MTIELKKLHNDSKIPTKGSCQAAGYDLYAYADADVNTISICSHTKTDIHTGIALAIPDGYVGLIFARSGLATKMGLRPANCVGVIDSDYRGELIVALFNDSNKDQSISNGERIAQLVIVPCLGDQITEVSSLSETKRGNNGFGSTGR